MQLLLLVVEQYYGSKWWLWVLRSRETSSLDIQILARSGLSNIAAVVEDKLEQNPWTGEQRN